jgi:vacuolar protein sorting-associated protein 35
MTEDILALYSALMSLTIAFYPSRIDNVDSVLKIVVEALEKRVEEQSKQSVVKQTLKLLTVPLDSFKNVLTLLKLEYYPKLMATLNATNKKKVAMDMVTAALENSVSVTEPEQVTKFLELISPLTADETTTQNPLDQVDQDDFEQEQNSVGSLVQLFTNTSLDTLFTMYITARKAFGQGGVKRVKHTLPPLVFCALKLAAKYKTNSANDEQWSAKAQKVFKFVHETITALCRTNYAEVSLKLFLQAAIVANKCGASFETIAYEFMTQAFIIYEEQVSDISTIQFNSIVTIIGSLQTLDIFTDENYDTLSTKTAVYSAKLLKKPDQCRAIYKCSHLFWRPNVANYNNQKRVLECLQKALKIADTCADSSLNVQLFVEILNEYLYYFENKCETVRLILCSFL